MSPQQPESTVFFLDHCLGRYQVAGALRSAGELVELHHMHFDDDAEDSKWLSEVGKRGWVVTTNDRHIKSNQIEIASMIEAKVACFNLVAADTKGPDMAGAVVTALPQIKKFLSKFDRPFVANTTRSGAVDLLYRYAELTRKLD
jgi:hypothetical protein